MGFPVQFRVGDAVQEALGNTDLSSRERLGLNVVSVVGERQERKPIFFNVSSNLYYSLFPSPSPYRTPSRIINAGLWGHRRWGGLQILLLAMI